MADRRRYVPRDRYRNAVNGNLAVAPDELEEPRRRKEPAKRPEKKRISREHKKEITVRPEPLVTQAPAIGLAGFVMLSIGAAVMLYSCIGYLRAESRLSEIKNSTVAIEKDYIELKADNDQLERTVYAGINLEEIRRTAIEKLGMVYPYENQIVKYDYNENGYVRQYDEFSTYAESLQDALLDDILGK